MKSINNGTNTLLSQGVQCDASLYYVDSIHDPRGRRLFSRIKFTNNFLVRWIEMDVIMADIHLAIYYCLNK